MATKMCQVTTNVSWMVSRLLLVFFLMLPPTVVSLDVATESYRAADAVLRNEIKNRGVAKENVAPILNIMGKRMVPVHADFGVISILAVDDVRQFIDTAVYAELSWLDPSLAWNASEHGGVEVVELSSESVWTPDVRVLNSYEQFKLINGADTLFLYSSGRFRAIIATVITSACNMDLFYYPFDEQVCPVIFFSFSGVLNFTIKLNHELTDRVVTILALSNEWDLIDSKVDLFNLELSGWYPKLLLTLKRKTTFYAVCLVLPMVLTSYMNTLVFLLPLQSGEKISFLVSIFVSTSVFISYLTSVMPRGIDSIPNAMILLLGVMTESVLTLLASILVLQLQYRQSQATQPTEQTTHQDSHDNAQTTNFSATEARPEQDAFAMDSVPSPRRSHMNISPYAWKNKKKSVLFRAKLFCRNLSANNLDYVFFVLAFAGNTIFLFTIYFSPN